MKKTIVIQDNISQRIDNFILKNIKNYPKDFIYKIIRKGVIKINNKKVSHKYKVKQYDQVTFPESFINNKKNINFNINNYYDLLNNLKKLIILEDENFIFLNKPSGISVHGGTKNRIGIIEILRCQKSYQNIELAHRLDKDTSGCLIFSKNLKALQNIHNLFKEKKIYKKYIAITYGNINKRSFHITCNIKKNSLFSNERISMIHNQGKYSKSYFYLLKRNNKLNINLMKIHPLTGRTHQIRIHAKSNNIPIIGDKKYGEKNLNKRFAKIFKTKKMLLHAKEIKFTYLKHKYNVICKNNIIDKISKKIFGSPGRT